MAERNNPKVSIGLPVYNGADFLDDAISSILSQDFTDFELIVSDNASTDETELIIQRWAERDQRVVSHLQPHNLGAAINFNTVMGMARGKYFRWAGHDDLLAPTMIRRCVEALDKADGSVVVVAPITTFIDEHGSEIGIDHPLELSEHETTARFREVVRKVGRANVLFGLMRTEAAQALRGLGSYPSADQVLIAELALRGRFLPIDEPLFFRRIHQESSWRTAGKFEGFAEWFDPQESPRLVFPTWRRWLEMVRAPIHAPLPWRTRLYCAAAAAVIWPKRKRRHLLKELLRVPATIARRRTGRSRST